MKGQFGNLADNNFQLFRVFQPRILNQNAVRTLTLHNRLSSTKAVDALGNDLDRLRDRMGYRIVDTLRCQGQPQHAVRGFADCNLADATLAEQACSDRPGQRFQLGFCRRNLASITQGHVDGGVAAS